MKTVSIRELRHHWPRAEALLESEGELVITRDSKPIAKLYPYSEPPRERKRFDPNEHAKWQDELHGGKNVELVQKYLLSDRE